MLLGRDAARGSSTGQRSRACWTLTGIGLPACGPLAPVRWPALAAWVERLEEGNRNSGLFWAACRVVEDGRAGRLGDLAEAAKRTGLPRREIARTIASARRTARTRGERQAAAGG